MKPLKTQKTKQATQIPPITPTIEQRIWLEKKKRKTGDSFASIIRGLIQEKIDSNQL